MNHIQNWGNTIRDGFFQTFDNLCKSEINHSIQNVALKIFKGFCIVFGLWLNPVLFSTFFAIGLLWNREVTEKLDECYAKLKCHQKKTIAVIFVFSIINFQVALISCSIISGARFGASFELPPPEPQASAASG